MFQSLAVNFRVIQPEREREREGERTFTTRTSEEHEGLVAKRFPGEDKARIEKREGGGKPINVFPGRVLKNSKVARGETLFLGQNYTWWLNREARATVSVEREGKGFLEEYLRTRR